MHYRIFTNDLLQPGHGAITMCYKLGTFPDPTGYSSRNRNPGGTIVVLKGGWGAPDRHPSGYRTLGVGFTRT